MELKDRRDALEVERLVLEVQKLRRDKLNGRRLVWIAALGLGGAMCTVTGGLASYAYMAYNARLTAEPRKVVSDLAVERDRIRDEIRGMLDEKRDHQARVRLAEIDRTHKARAKAVQELNALHTAQLAKLDAAERRASEATHRLRETTADLDRTRAWLQEAVKDTVTRSEALVDQARILERIDHNERVHRRILGALRTSTEAVDPERRQMFREIAEAWAADDYLPRSRHRTLGRQAMSRYPKFSDALATLRGDEDHLRKQCQALDARPPKRIDAQEVPLSPSRRFIPAEKGFSFLYH
jgi:hypothetical protein